MTFQANRQSGADSSPIRYRRSRLSFRNGFRTAPLSARIGLVVIAIYIAMAVFAPLLAPFGEADVVSSEPFAPWSIIHLLGTDQMGRDVLSRLIYGARNSVGIAFITTSLAFVVGAGLGIFSAVSSPWCDSILSVVADTLMAIPQLIFALILLALFGSSITSIVLIIAMLNATQIFRLSRLLARNVVVMEYIEAAYLRAESTWWIVTKEILPNVLPTLLAEFGLRFCFVFLTISALSFLGLGIQPPSADWGTMVRESATFISYGNVTPLLPAASIAILTVSINFVIDWFLDVTSGLRNDS
ncbi:MULTISPECIES: ABC transporter permease [Mesorhizobium]|uniref:ABC transporter permease n=1 Tax=Mesorhizobium TaxID=68287 RepID=UPI0009BCF554|nr:ABC transporter permease [Mesorhizobium loti]QKC89272.1 ABC transporter permease [Mesorhizobium sp. NZP2234]